MTFETLKWQQTGGVGLLTLSRPASLNALNHLLLKELDQFLTCVPDIPGLRALVVTGDGEKSFVAGADIKEMEAFGSAEALKMAQNGQRIFSRLEHLPIPVIAAVNGFALGGGLELALSCDFIIASQKARFGLPEVSLGLIPGYGGTQRLSRTVGMGVARLMTLTGDIFPADEAARWGLATMVVAPEELLPKALKIAETIAKRGPVALRLAKTAMNEGFDQPLPRALALEAQLFGEVFATADKNEGVKAFIEKRSPNFEGR